MQIHRIVFLTFVLSVGLVAAVGAGDSDWVSKFIAKIKEIIEKLYGSGKMAEAAPYIAAALAAWFWMHNLLITGAILIAPKIATANVTAATVPFAVGVVVYRTQPLVGRVLFAVAGVSLLTGWSIL